MASTTYDLTGESQQHHSLIWRVMATVAALGLTFQIGHFFEHFFQFVVWLLGDFSNLCGRNTPYMTPWATALVAYAGAYLFPSMDAPRQMMISMEVLHLVGNSIFLVSIASLYYCLPNKWIRWAFYVETFHLYEHLMLTLSAYFIGKPIGMSTLFGGAFSLEKEAAVGVRVSWHFVMNLIPPMMVLNGVLEALDEKKLALAGK